MTRILTAMFDSHGAAVDVVEHLVQHDGVDRARLSIHGHDTGAPGTPLPPDQTGFWATLRSLFVSDDDRLLYSEGIRRGHFLVSAELDAELVPHAIAVFESHGAIDLDAHEAEWRSSGWRGPQPGGAAAPPLAGIGNAAGAATDTNYLTGASEDRSTGERDADGNQARVRTYIPARPQS